MYKFIVIILATVVVATIIAGCKKNLPGLEEIIATASVVENSAVEATEEVIAEKSAAEITEEISDNVLIDIFTVDMLGDMSWAKDYKPYDIELAGELMDELFSDDTTTFVKGTSLFDVTSIKGGYYEYEHAEDGLVLGTRCFVFCGGIEAADIEALDPDDDDPFSSLYLYAGILTGTRLSDEDFSLIRKSIAKVIETHETVVIKIDWRQIYLSYEHGSYICMQ